MADDKQDDQKKTPSRSKAQIERDIAAARARLSGSIETLITEAHPKTLVNRQVDSAKAFVQGEVNNARDEAKAQVLDADGAPRWDRIAIIGGAVAGALTFILTVRAIVMKNKRKRGEIEIEKLLKAIKQRTDIDLDELLKRAGR